MADYNQQTASFLSWFKSLPGATFSDSITVSDLRDRNAGRGIVATHDIPADTTLFTIPRKSIINVETSALKSLIPSIFEDPDSMSIDDAPQLDSWSSLILIMMYEHLLGDKSSWKPYFDVLPTSFDTPMFWSSDELKHLQASATVNKIGKESAEDMFKTLLIPAIRGNGEVFAAAKGMSDEDLVLLAHRMGSTIMAYAFDLENEDDEEEEEEWVEDRDGKSLMGMVPMADIMNADAEFNAHVNHEDDALTVTSLRAIKAGDQILNYYGPHPNSELLRRYGYTTPLHARYDVVEIAWSVVEASMSLHLNTSPEQLQKIRDVFDQEDLEDTFVLERETGEVNPDGTFADPASFVEIPADLAEQLKQFLKAAKDIKPDLSEKRKREEMQLAIVATALEKLQGQYATSIEEDEALLKGVNGRESMAVVVRLGEKKLLREARAFLAEKMGETESGSNKRARLG